LPVLLSAHSRLLPPAGLPRIRRPNPERLPERLQEGTWMSRGPSGVRGLPPDRGPARLPRQSEATAGAEELRGRPGPCRGTAPGSTIPGGGGDPAGEEPEGAGSPRPALSGPALLHHGAPSPRHEREGDRPQARLRRGDREGAVAAGTQAASAAPTGDLMLLRPPRGRLNERG